MLGAIMGLCVGDALGVPVEFVDREALKKDPVVDFRGYGSHHQPIGTWSDDTSLTLCLMDCLKSGFDEEEIMSRFAAWYQKGEFSPRGEVFDVGITTRQSILRYLSGTPAAACGGTSEQENGNGALMRILPLVFYLRAKFGNEFSHCEEAYELIHRTAALTHGHPRSKMACGLYIVIASELMNQQDHKTAVDEGLEKAFTFYERQPAFVSELNTFNRLRSKDFSKLHEDSIKSGGYVVDTLEASIWCLLNTSSYKACVLKAVNLGFDTDTTGAVAGGLAGLYYGISCIPDHWRCQVVKRGLIEELVKQLEFQI